METRKTTNQTPAAIRAAIEDCFKNNPRKRVFQALAECSGAVLIAAPETDFLPNNADFRGLCGLRRELWGTAPGYADRVCNYLAGLMTGRRVELNGRA